MIEGGFYLKARCIQNADIAHAPPHVREIWDWLLLKASFNDGKILKRGQVFVSYTMIIDALSWNVGWRKMHYSRSDCENAMKALRKAGMIATKKTTRGLLVTICKYEYYQNIKNYESHNESDRKATGEPQERHTIVKELKNIKKKRKNIGEVFQLPSDVDVETWSAFEEMRITIKKPLTDRARKNIITSLDKIGQDKNEVLNQSITNCWRDVYKLRENNNGTGSAPQKKTKEKWEQILDGEITTW